MSKTPLAVLVLPMDSKKMFKDYGKWHDVQQEFFRDELPLENEGEYLYLSKRPDAKAGTTVLFQYKGRIVASAVSKKVNAFKKPTDDGCAGKYYKRGFRGTLYLKPKSIKVFDPVDADGIRRFWPRFKGFAQAMQNLPPTPYPRFDKTLTHVEFAKY